MRQPNDSDQQNQAAQTTLSDTERQTIQRAYKAFKSLLPGFTERTQQRQMIAEVSNALGAKELSVVEAPTGTGKSASYLLPGAVLACLRGTPLVVSTATTSLQDQLAVKDIPLIAKALHLVGLHVKYALAKGRERHLCLAKLDSVGLQSDMFDADPDAAEIQGISSKWDSGTWDGLRDSYGEPVKRVIWAKVNNTSATCTGNNCEHFEQCPYYVGLKKIDEANIIITNHDYLLACLVHSPKSRLSQHESNIYVFDEAHHLDAKCLSAFAKEISLGTDRDSQISAAMGLMKASMARINMAITQCALLRETIRRNCADLLRGDSQFVFEMGQAPVEFMELINQYRVFSIDILKQVEAAYEQFARNGKGGALQTLANIRIATVRSDIELEIDAYAEFLDEDEEKARWISDTKSGLKLQCSPFDSRKVAQTYLWPRIKVGILTSATLSTMGNFESLRRSLGLPAQTRTLRLDSPLDYSNAQIVVPRLTGSATDVGHTAMAMSFIRRDGYQLPPRGVLVYFTSKKQMEKVYSGLSEAEKQITLVQGQMTTAAMIEHHKARIDAGGKSVLFGLDSLSEGIDLPGEYCSCVIVVRLPFPMPGDPILSTHAKILEKKGMQPFHLLMLPVAATKFAQIVGRLIRKEGDWGWVIVLDDRLVSKRYGAQLLKSTPFKRIDQTMQPFVREQHKPVLLH